MDGAGGVGGVIPNNWRSDAFNWRMDRVGAAAMNRDGCLDDIADATAVAGSGIWREDLVSGGNWRLGETASRTGTVTALGLDEYRRRSTSG